MSEFGHVLNDFDPNRDNVYASFCDYFNNPQMGKVKNTDGLSMYACKTTCLLINKCRYLIALVPQDQYEVGTRFSLSDLNWTCFQTRVLVGKFDVPVHFFQTEVKAPFDSEIYEESKDFSTTNYTCPALCLKVTLLHTKKENLWEYSPKGTLSTALETYQTVITF